MESPILKQIANFLQEQKKHKHWRAAFVCLAVLVGFGTVTALKLMGQALTHKEKILTCQLSVHEHVPECYDEENNLICGYADYVVHVHNDDCYATDGSLACQIPEMKEHKHTEECYEEQETLVCTQGESEGHVHTDACYTSQQGELQCQTSEHVHDENCFDESGALVCGMEEHQHSDACYATEQVVICGMEEGEGVHTHSTECYQTEKVLTCGLLELHTHTDECNDEDGNRICGMVQLEEHVHADDCFEIVEMTAEEIAASESKAESKEKNAEKKEEEAQEEGTGDKAETEETESPVIDEGTIVKTFEGEDFIVTASYEESANIPEEAELIAAQITEESDPERYAQREEEMQQTLTGKVNVMSALFEIGFYVDGEEVEPESQVAVTIQFLDENGLPEGTPIKVIHFADKGTEVLEGSEMDEKGATTFKMDSFSEVGVVPELERDELGRYVLTDYLDKKKGVTYDIKFLTEAGIALPVDEYGNVIVRANENYQMRFLMNAVEGLDAGTYVYQLPTDNIVLKEVLNCSEDHEHTGECYVGESGPLLIDKTEVGEWSVDPHTGEVTFELYEKISGFSNISFALSFFIKFKETNGVIALPGDLHVSIQVDKGKSSVSKWEYLRGGEKVARSSKKIEWISELEVKGNDKIIGATITDTIETPESTSFEAEDKAAGIRFVVVEPGVPTGGTEGDWASWDHTWVVKEGDSNLKYFNAEGWQYIMPEKIVCAKCKNEITLSDKWKYYTVCTSTIPDTIVTSGGMAFNENRIELQHTNNGDQEDVLAHGQSKHTFGEEGADIFKDYEYDAEAKKIRWKIDAYIPPASFFTDGLGVINIEDKMYLAGYNSKNQIIKDDVSGIVDNDLGQDNITTVTATGKDGSPISITKATLVDNVIGNNIYQMDDPKAKIAWYVEKGAESEVYMKLAAECQCTAENCLNWKEDQNGGRCGYLALQRKPVGQYVADEGDINPKTGQKGSGYILGDYVYFGRHCLCWQCNQQINLHIEYETSKAYLAEAELKCTQGHAPSEHTSECYDSSTVKFSEEAEDIFQVYGGKNCEVKNVVKLARTTPSGWKPLGTDKESVTLPGMFEKTLEQQPSKANGWTATYSITINEAKQDLSRSEDGTVSYDNVELKDTLSESLVLNEASLVIEAEDANNKKTTLECGADKDYTLEYNSNEHCMTITLLKPGPIKYVIRYSATMVGEGGTTDLKYSNQAEITMQGKTYSDDTGTRDALGAVISAESYSVHLLKESDENNQKLSGAEFQVCTSQGNILAKVTTDRDGKASVVTDTSKGIYFTDHTLYYFEETKAPEGYVLDTTKHWFIFCKDKNEEGVCSKFEADFDELSVEVVQAMGGTKYEELKAFQSGVKVLSGKEKKTDTKAVLTITNKKGYQLPKTGGIGDWPMYIAALMIAGASSLFGYKQVKRRKAKIMS